MVDFPLEKVKEGKTEVLVPDVEAFRKSPASYPPSDAPVFYNKKMEINRDFALATLRYYIKKITSKEEILYCEPMAGSGIRSIRVANEIPSVKVIINDLNPQAVALIESNVSNLKLTKNVEVYKEDANTLLLRNASNGKRFDVIDIDPFGSPSPFLDSTAQALTYNGLLAVTSTDMATMYGVYPKACIRKYASKPIHSFIGHEIAIRMQYGFIATALARHGKGMKPLFAHSTEHFIRTYSIAIKGITSAKKAMDNLGFVAHCQECYEIETQKSIVNKLDIICPECQSKRLLGGPYWLGKIYDQKTVSGLKIEISKNKEKYGQSKKMLKMLEMIHEEAKIEKEDETIRFYYDIHQISDKLNIPSPNFTTIITILRSNGFLASRTHIRPTAIKTNASTKQLIAVMQEALPKE